MKKIICCFLVSFLLSYSVANEETSFFVLIKISLVGSNYGKSIPVVSSVLGKYDSYEICRTAITNIKKKTNAKNIFFNGKSILYVKNNNSSEYYSCDKINGK